MMDTKSNWEDSDDLDPCCLKVPFHQAIISLLHRYIHKYFRSRQAIFYLKDILKHPGKLTRAKLRRIFLFPYYVIFSIAYRLILRIKEFAGTPHQRS